MTTDFQALQIRPGLPDATLSEPQQRFNALVRDVALARTALAEWKDRIDRHEQAVGPVRRQVNDAFRQWVLALDAASLQPGLSRAERGQLGDLLREAATDWLSVEADDTEIAQALGRHQEHGPPDSEGADADASLARGSASIDTNPVLSEEELFAQMAQQWEQQADAAAALREQRSASRRAASARKRQAQQAQQVSHSLRDVYRKLASALHPDRETDAKERARKTELMQQANLAYAAGNLLVLLELQLRAELVDAARLATLDARRLEHYITVLQEQLAELQAETRRLEDGFRAAVGAAPGSGLQLRKADRLISAEAQRLRGDLQQLGLQARMLRDPEATKAWLKALRRG